MKLTKSLAAWNTSDFPKVFKVEVEQIDKYSLPLATAMVHGGQLGSGAIQAMLLHSGEEGGVIHVRAGIFFTSVIAGCNCSDDPSTVSENAEYCELVFHIDLHGAQTQVLLVTD